MDSLISTFHINLSLLLAQAINFIIVFVVLYYFILNPIIKVMKERSETIDKSLKEAQDIKERLDKVKRDYYDTMAVARSEANGIIEKAKTDADKKGKEMIEKAKEEIGKIINEEKNKIQADKFQVLKEIKKDVADLVAIALEKVLGEKIDSAKDKEIINKIIKK
jgi:F-type H+-transporting ATPase subunit b